MTYSINVIIHFKSENADPGPKRNGTKRKKRRLLAMGFTRILGTYYSTCVTSLGDSSPSRPDLSLMRRLDGVFPGNMTTMWNSQFGTAKKQSKRGAEGYNAWVAIPDMIVGRGDKTVRSFCLFVVLTFE